MFLDGTHEESNIYQRDEADTYNLIPNHMLIHFKILGNVGKIMIQN